MHLINRINSTEYKPPSTLKLYNNVLFKLLTKRKLHRTKRHPQPFLKWCFVSIYLWGYYHCDKSKIAMKTVFTSLWKNTPTWKITRRFSDRIITRSKLARGFSTQSAKCPFSTGVKPSSLVACSDKLFYNWREIRKWSE